jgi:hypothetical protein
MAWTQATACSASPRFWGIGARGRRWAARPRVMADRGVADAPAPTQRRGSPLGERCQGSAERKTGRGEGDGLGLAGKLALGYSGFP